MEDKKFTKSKRLTNYEVLTDNGWVDIDAIHETIEYDVWELKTKNHFLKCADKHILFNDNFDEVFVEDIKIGDNIITEYGVEEILSIVKTNKKESMFDLELNIDSDKRYYTNGILSHNTTYIRHLLRKLKEINKDNNVLYFPPTMVGSITDPNFINFISEWVIDSKGRNYLLIEDAEPLLESRDASRNIGITNLLNLTDGLLNDILNVQIIATFNTKLSNIDSALLRPERLMARKEFEVLSIEKGKILASKIDINPDLITKKMTLADIYSLKNERKPITHNIDNKVNDGKVRGFGDRD
jgi:hypothetical protein